MPPNTSPEKCSVIVTIYKYFEAESEERRQSIAGIKSMSEHCQIKEMCVCSVYSYFNRLYFSILFSVESITCFEQYRYTTVGNDW